MARSSAAKIAAREESEQRQREAQAAWYAALPLRLLKLIADARGEYVEVDIANKFDTVVVTFTWHRPGDSYSVDRTVCLNSDQWEVESIEQEIAGLRAERLERERKEALRKQTVEKVRTLLSPEELAAIGIK